MDQFGSGRSAVVSLLRNALSFTVGSALILQEKGEAFTQQAFERGKEAQDQGRKLVQEMRAERKQRPTKPVDPLDISIEFALDRLSIPTHSDIQDLNQRISELTQRIDEL